MACGPVGKPLNLDHFKVLPTEILSLISTDALIWSLCPSFYNYEAVFPRAVTPIVIAGL